MTRETRFKLLHARDYLLDSIPFVAIAAGVVGLVWMVLSWSKKANEAAAPEKESIPSQLEGSNS